MPPVYGYSIGVFSSIIGNILVPMSGCVNIFDKRVVFLLTFKHNYSIAIRRSVDDMAYIKERFFYAPYLSGIGRARKIIIMPDLHTGHFRLSFPEIFR